VNDGLLIVDKPAGLTSHDVVARVRRLAGTRKVGHAGTLDPMATGVLVLGIERATRLLTYLVGATKSYDATIRLGASTITDDAEGETTVTADAAVVAAVTDEAIAAGVRALTGDLLQVPSAVSAIKVDGKRSYARVRAGESVELAARPVTVSRFDVLAVRRAAVNDAAVNDAAVNDANGHDATGHDADGAGHHAEAAGAAVIDVDVSVDCTSGTYIRALARDLGAGLGVGGHLTALRRTAVGPYGLDVARTLEQLGEDFQVLPMAQAARAAFPARELSDDEARKLTHGQRLPSTGASEVPTAAFAPDGTLIAIVSDTGPTCRPLLVLVG
jgi:tRNA pseudouridine55 synthase